jgi:hypothetical protein
VASDKAYAAELNIAGLAPGPWITLTPLRAGWQLGAAGFAWARYRPSDNSVELLFDVSATSGVTAAQLTDDYQWATMPGTDQNGNDLLPPQTGEVIITTDRLQTTTPSSPRVRISPGGPVRLYGLASTATWMRCHCGRYTMDALP